MTIDIAFLESAPIQHRFKDGKIWDVIDYPFRISDGKSTCIVNVGITGQFHDPAEALGSKGLTKGELVEAARTWLRSRIDKGDCDPIAHPERDLYIDVPPGVMDYWAEHRSIPDWI
jgi:hypothetical protein